MSVEMQTRRFEGDGGIHLVADVAGDPDGVPVLFFHGGGQTRHSWAGAVRSVAERGYSVASFDLRGHGDSDWSPDGDYFGGAFARDVIAIAKQFDRPVLVGASLGGSSSLAAVHLAGEPIARALVLVDIAPHIEERGVSRIREFMREHAESGFGSLEEVADAVAGYNPHRPRPKSLEGLKKNVRRRDDGRWYWHWDPAFMFGIGGDADEPRVVNPRTRTDDLVAAATSLTIPTLLVRGRQSDLLSEEGARRFLELVPHAEYADVAGAGHMVAGDRNDAFNGAILDFLGRIEG